MALQCFSEDRIFVIIQVKKKQLKRNESGTQLKHAKLQISMKRTKSNSTSHKIEGSAYKLVFESSKISNYDKRRNMGAFKRPGKLFENFWNIESEE